MKTPTILTETISAPDGGSLALLRVPFVFTQDKLLSSGDFIKEAAERGNRIELADLQALHNHRLLIPLFRVSDTAVAGRRIEAEEFGGMNPRGWALDAAREGRLRDCLDEGYSVDWPYERPNDSSS